MSGRHNRLHRKTNDEREKDRHDKGGKDRQDETRESSALFHFFQEMSSLMPEKVEMESRLERENACRSVCVLRV